MDVDLQVGAVVGIQRKKPWRSIAWLEDRSVRLHHAQRDFGANLDPIARAFASPAHGGPLRSRVRATHLDGPLATMAFGRRGKNDVYGGEERPSFAVDRTAVI